VSTPLSNDAVSLLLIHPEASESAASTRISGVSALAGAHPKEHMTIGKAMHARR
jgi:hypothetical protein